MAVRPLFDIEEWRKNQDENFIERQNALIQAIARAEPEQRPQARLDLARFYMARGMYPEVKGETEAGPCRSRSEEGRIHHDDGARGREHPDRPAGRRG